MAKRTEDGGEKPPEITIINHEARWTRFPIQSVPERFRRLKPHQRQVHNKIVALKPGANTISLADWQIIRGKRGGDDERDSVDLAEQHVDDGLLQEITKPIHTMPVAEAIKIVKMTIDEPILLGVQGRDKRTKVQAAVTAQLLAIKGDAHTARQLAAN